MQIFFINSHEQLKIVAEKKFEGTASYDSVPPNRDAQNQQIVNWHQARGSP